VAVRRAQPKLAHSPRLFAQVLENLGARGDRFAVVGGDIVDSEIRDIAVVSELACGWDIGAAAQHERDPARAAERPIPRINFVDLAAEHVAIPRSGSFEIMNCENGIGSHDRHGSILPQAGTVVPSRVERSAGRMAKRHTVTDAIVVAVPRQKPIAVHLSLSALKRSLSGAA
jgi:hypothetical protein